MNDTQKLFFKILNYINETELKYGAAAVLFKLRKDANNAYKIKDYDTLNKILKRAQSARYRMKRNLGY